MGTTTPMPTPITKVTQYNLRRDFRLVTQSPTWKRIRNIHCNRTCRQSHNSSPKNLNEYRSCEKCKSNHSIATCPEYQPCHPIEKYSIASKTVCAQTVGVETTPNKLVRQQNNANYAMAFTIQLCTTQQNKLNAQQQVFQLKTSGGINLQSRRLTRHRLKKLPVVRNKKTAENK